MSITDNITIAEIMNDHFVNITTTLDLNSSINQVNDCTVQDVLQHYNNHESISKIKENNEANLLKFAFKLIEEDVPKIVILNLNSKKGVLHDCIPITLLKDSCDLYILQLNDIINHCLENNIFPNKLNLANAIPIYKKTDSLKKENYRPIDLFINKLRNKSNPYQFVFMKNRFHNLIPLEKVCHIEEN